MIINYTFDNSWNSAPAGVEAQAQAAAGQVVNLYDTLFTNNITINLTFQWGVLAANKGATNNGGGGGLIFNYAQILAYLQGDENSPAQKIAFGTLPNTDPTGSNNFSVTPSEAQALGVPNVPALYAQVYGSPLPGSTVTFNSTFSWTTTTFFNVAAHEISEIMGRAGDVGVLYSGLGSPNGPENNQPLYTPMDLFRYTASGQFDSTFGTKTTNSLAYFGYDKGQVLTTAAFNNGAIGGDPGDWAVTVLPNGDAYGTVDGNPGQISGTDLTLMNLVGWNLANLTVGQLQNVYAVDPAPNLSLAIVDSSSNVTKAMDPGGSGAERRDWLDRFYGPHTYSGVEHYPGHWRCRGVPPHQRPVRIVCQLVGDPAHLHAAGQCPLYQVDWLRRCDPHWQFAE